MKSKLAAVLVAVMLITAGCSGFGGEPGDGTSGEPGDGGGDGSGTVTFYISDQQNAIDEFDHLNVTVSTVGFVPADANGTDGDANGTDGDANETETDENETDTRSGDGEAGSVEFSVEDRTVDLTELKGANATVLDEFEVPNGTYGQAYIEVSAVNGTLTDGSSAAVKLPSQRLRLNQEFTVGNNESVDFVYDVSVVKRGNSGKYNIRPVASESGPDQEIRNVDGEERDEGEGTVDGGATNESAAGAALNATFVGNVTRGENATVRVTRNGTAVGNATVEYDGNETATDVDGNVTLAVPADAEEIEVEIEHEGESVTLKETFGRAAEDGIEGSDGSTDEGNPGGEESTATATPTTTTTG